MRDNILQVNSLNHGSLFGVNGESLGYLFNKELKKVCNSLSLPELTSHSFRHSMGYHLLRAGCDIRYIQELLGHKRLKNTQIYTRVDKDDLREVVDKYLPRSIRSKDEA